MKLLVTGGAGYIILNSIKIMNRDPLIFNVIENYNEGE